MTFRAASSLFPKAILPSIAAAATPSTTVAAAAAVVFATVTTTYYSPQPLSTLPSSNHTVRPKSNNDPFRPLLHRVSCEGRHRPSPTGAASLGHTTTSSSNFVADAVEKVLPSVVRVEVHVKPSIAPTGVSCYIQRGSGSGFMVFAKDILLRGKEHDDPTINNPENNHPQHGNNDENEYNDNEYNDDEEILVMTNAHCVLTPTEFQNNTHDEESKMVYLELHDDRVVSGRIIAFDTDLDVALIRPNGLDDGGVVKVASLLLVQGRSDDGKRQSVRHGEFIAAIGAPLELENTVTVGIVSNPRRYCRHHPGKAYIQTDNSCHVGNSGGPLINMDGQVIGITAKKVADGISYSIPIDDAVERLRYALCCNSVRKYGHATNRSNDAERLDISTGTKQSVDTTSESRTNSNPLPYVTERLAI
ncbi:endopeptidase [Nitzschia inconspicua]|uniref:Endopeptidase n=1 Tax=Nitzschia inconspicua TaxID=303405 RepID=A0A9K3K675_9STRA|nr:endopeptidase [Nitzschia inconspicua]KAG7362277.1 endopeptidase [Nitzschia inconspicua]